jgi:hypothetical protein
VLNRFKKRHVHYALAVLAVVFVASLAVINQSAIYNQLNDWKLLPQPEGTTELYFNEHLSLPNKYTPGDKYNVSFTVHSVEYKSQTYTYEIIQKDDTNNSTHVLNKGNFSLENNQYESRLAPITYVESGERSSIIINLLNKNQTILYHVGRQVK